MLKISEVARIMKVNDASVRKLINSRLLKATNVSGAPKRNAWRIEESDLDKFLNR